MPDELPKPVCPHATAVAGSVRGLSGVICGVMARDQQRADSILEGAPVGVFINWAEDTSTLANLCCGQGEPVLSPDDLPDRPFGMGHYSACPVFAAAKEITAAERAFAPREREAATLHTGAVELTDAYPEYAEVRDLIGGGETA